MATRLQSAPALPRNRLTFARRISAKSVLVFLAVLAAPALMLMLIHRYGVNVPFWDEWDELSVVPKALGGALDFASLFAQQNEHRPITSRLVSILLAKTSRLNLVHEMYLGFATSFLSLILIWRMLIRALKDRANALIGPLTIVSSLLLFWTVAWENWTWGIASFQYLSAVFWAVLAVWGFTGWRGKRGVMIGSAATALAIYTTGHGFALIPVGLLWLLASGMADKRVRWLHVSAFGMVALGCTALYLRNYHSPGFYSQTLPRVRPLQIALYVITYIGSPFWTTKWGVASTLGSLGIAAIAASAYYIARSMPDWMESAAPWFLLALYTIINGIVTALGRIDFGVEQANQPRYRSIVVPLWISLVVILAMITFHISAWIDRRALSTAIASVIIVFLGGYGYLYYRGFRYIRSHSQLCADGLPYVLQYDIAPDEALRLLHPYPGTVKALSRKLDQYRLGPFAK
jgi:hypothetical protein